MLQFIMQPVAVIFCGHLGKAELDAVALANSVSMCVPFNYRFLFPTHPTEIGLILEGFP